MAEEIICSAADAVGLPASLIKGPSKIRAVSMARKIAVLLMKENGISLSESGKALGARSSGTIARALRDARMWTASSSSAQKLLASIREGINARRARRAEEEAIAY